MQRYLEAREMTFKRRDGDDERVICDDSDKLLVAKCPGDNTNLLERKDTNGETLIYCPNCCKSYVSSASLDDSNYTQRYFNQRYREIVAMMKTTINQEKRSFAQRESRLLEELERVEKIIAEMKE